MAKYKRLSRHNFKSIGRRRIRKPSDDGLGQPYKNITLMFNKGSQRIRNAVADEGTPADTTSFITVWEVPSAGVLEWPIYNLEDAYFGGDMTIEEMDGTVISTNSFSGKATVADFQWENLGATREVRCRITGQFGGVSTYISGYASGYAPTAMINWLKKVEQIGAVGWRRSTWGFRGCLALESINFANFDGSNLDTTTTSPISAGLANQGSLTSVSLAGLDLTLWPAGCNRLGFFGNDAGVVPFPSSISSIDYAGIIDDGHLESVGGEWARFADVLTSISNFDTRNLSNVTIATNMTISPWPLSTTLYDQILGDMLTSANRDGTSTCTFAFADCLHSASMNATIATLAGLGWTITDAGEA